MIPDRMRFLYTAGIVFPFLENRKRDLCLAWSMVSSDAKAPFTVMELDWDFQNLASGWAVWENNYSGHRILSFLIWHLWAAQWKQGCCSTCSAAVQPVHLVMQGAVFGKVGRLAIELLGDSPPRKIYVQFSLSATSDEERMEKCHYREEDYYNWKWSY